MSEFELRKRPPTDNIFASLFDEKSDETLEKITRDAQRVMEDKSPEQIIRGMCSQYNIDDVNLTSQNVNGVPVWTANILLDEKLREDISKKIAERKYERLPILNGKPPIELLPHDGKLGEWATVGYRESFHDIRINDGSSGIAYIDAKQALSLLVWLLQEQQHLKELAGVMSVEDLTGRTHE